MALETPSRPPLPFMANAILKFHFDFLKPSLMKIMKMMNDRHRFIITMKTMNISFEVMPFIKESGGVP